MGRWPPPLTRAFLARFFETEISDGSHDVKAAFIWLIAALSAPGFVAPILLMGWDWSVLGQAYGHVALREITRADKILYLGLSMVAAGGISALVWNSLLIDRRDALVLGTLPLRPGAVVRAKLTAIAIYVLTIAAAMHVLASLTFGEMLSVGSWSRFATGVAAHATASFLASAFVLLGVTAAQAVMTIVLGPARLARASAWLQAALVAAMLVLFVSLPGLSQAGSRALGGARVEFHPRARELRFVAAQPPTARATATFPNWVAATPPIWFFGLYEVIQGTDQPAARRAARSGLWATLIALGITVAGLPLAYRRVMVAGVESAPLADTTGWRARKLETLLAAAPLSQPDRGLVQFFLATTGRVSRQRFVMAAALGASLAWTIPVLVRAMTTGLFSGPRPAVELTSLVCSVMMSVLVGLRLAAAMPADLRPGWIFAMAPAAPGAPAATLRRLLLVVGVVPPAGAVLVGFGAIWGAATGLAGAVLVAAGGWLLTEALVMQYAGVPAAHPWQHERARLRRLWPLVLAPIILLTSAPGWALYVGPVAALAVAVGMLAAAGALALAHARAAAFDPPGRDEHAAAFQVLGLD